MNEDKDDRLWEKSKSGGEIAPPLTPEQQEAVQKLNLRPFKPYVFPPPRKRRQPRS